MHAAAGVRNRDDAAAAGGRALDLANHLSEVEFGYHDRLHAFGDGGNRLFGEGPGGDKAEHSDFESILPRDFDGALRHARSDAVGNHYHVGAFDLVGFELDDAIGGLADLVAQTVD